MATWTIPRTYTPSQLVYAVRHARTHPDDRYLIQGQEVLTSPQYLRWFLSCLHAKISSKDPRTPTGRKLSPAYRLGLYRDAQRLRGYGGMCVPLTYVCTWSACRRFLTSGVSSTLPMCSDRQCESRH